MSAIPAKIMDTMHELENEYTSLANVPPTDASFIRLKNFFGNTQKESRIKQLICEGYTAKEIADKTEASLSTVRKVAKKHRLIIRQKFGYAAIKKGSSRIFSATYKGYRAIAEVNISNFESAERGLGKEGYHLRKIRKPVRWGKLLPGDLYIENGEINVKE